MPRKSLFDDTDLYDFDLEFVARLPKGAQFSWATRAQRRFRERGYVFTLKEINDKLHIDGAVQWSNGVRQSLIPRHGFDIVDCCKSEVFVKLDMRFTQYDFRITGVNLGSLESQDDLFNKPLNPGYTFRDGYSGFRHGTVAFFEDLASPSHAQVESVKVTNAK